MATLASLIGTQQGTVAAGNAALATALENIVILGTLTGRQIGTLDDLEAPLQAAVGMYLPTFFLVARKAGDVVREGASG